MTARLALLAVVALAVPTAFLFAGSAAATPAVCIVKEAEAGPVSAEVWVTCGPAATVEVCPPPGVRQPCRVVSVGSHP